jgi:5,10-methylene-tetrahydrofolate dehydrogenase/methenyl tetrahydrofolate cyclohydrolase
VGSAARDYKKANMKLIQPDKIIESLEDYAIHPYAGNKIYLSVIAKNNPTLESIELLKLIKHYAKKYGVIVQVTSTDSPVEAINTIKLSRENPYVMGITIVSDYGEATQALHNAIPSRLDINCCSSDALGFLATVNSPVAYRWGPCYATAVVKILEYQYPNEKNRHVAIVGNTIRFGLPLALMLSRLNYSVMLFPDIKATDGKLSEFDIVVSNIGDKEVLSAEDVTSPSGKMPHILIDTGMLTNFYQGSEHGDINLSSFKDKDVYIASSIDCVTPVALTVLMAKLCTHKAEILNLVPDDFLHREVKS